MKVLHLPASIAGNAYGLSQGEKKIGIASQVLTIGRQRQNYASDITVEVGCSLASQFYQRLKVFLKIRKGYDVYHFNYGSSLIHYLSYGINLWDLPFYDEKAVKVVTYQGCDARQKYPTMLRQQALGNEMAACFQKECYAGVCNSGKRDYYRRAAIEKMVKYTDHCFALNPDLLYFLPKEKSSFLPYTVSNFNLIKPKSQHFFSEDKITIVHAPTQRITKGSALIIKAIEELKNEFPNKINFIIIENLSYEQALKAYQQADLFIDQLLIGWYGGVAVEVMKMGIPVAVFINEAHLAYVPDDLAYELPFIRVNMLNIKFKIRDIIKNRDCLHELSLRSIRFVNKWHNPIEVAKITQRVYQKCAV